MINKSCVIFVNTFRINQCGLFCTALNKPSGSQALPIRCKRLFNMETFSSVMNNLEYRAMKRVKRAVTIKTPNRIDGSDMFYEVGSIMFMKEIKGNYEFVLWKLSRNLG